MMVIALDTHALPASVAGRGHCRNEALCPEVISWSSRARRCARISIWMLFESRTDIAYYALSGFARFGPLNGLEFIIG
ncbi:unnamed protein product [Prunus armeniaca]